MKPKLSPFIEPYGGSVGSENMEVDCFHTMSIP